VSDIKLFRVDQQGAAEIKGTSVAVEKSLQTMIEKYLDMFLGVRFLASEYITGKTHGGRIDTLGIDENNYPVIIEYKRTRDENVINQGLSYLNWLMDHKAEFQLLVLKRFGEQAASTIEWSAPRLVCIAGDFNRYDEDAVQQIGRNVELVRYRRYGDHLVLLDLVTTASGDSSARSKSSSAGNQNVIDESTAESSKVLQRLTKTPPEVRERFETLRKRILALGDDIQEKTLDRYIAFRRIRNFATVRFRPQTGRLLLYVNVDPDVE